MVIHAARLSAELVLLDPTPIVGLGHARRGRRADRRIRRRRVSYRLVALHILPLRLQCFRPKDFAVRRAPWHRPTAFASLPDKSRGIAWDGLQYDVVFTATHNGFPTALYVTHTAAQGALESLTPQAVVSLSSNPDVSLIVTGTGSIAITYTRVGVEPEYGDAERVFITAPHLLRARAAR